MSRTEKQSGSLRARLSRTCVGCRERAVRTALVRLALKDGAVALASPARPMSGRGAWLHPSPVCLEKALRARAFSRAFRAPVEVTAEAAQALGAELARFRGI